MQITQNSASFRLVSGITEQAAVLSWIPAALATKTTRHHLSGEPPKSAPLTLKGRLA